MQLVLRRTIVVGGVAGQLLCDICLHLNKNSPGKCRAFPKGIPSGIISGQLEHREIHPAQNGSAVFEQEA